MEEEFVLTVGEGESKVKYLIERVIPMDDKCFFTILNLSNFDFMFGEYTGPQAEDPEETRLRIWQDFGRGCPNISYPDGYIVDDLYEMIDIF